MGAQGELRGGGGKGLQRPIRFTICLSCTKFIEHTIGPVSIKLH